MYSDMGKKKQSSISSLSFPVKVPLGSQGGAIPIYSKNCLVRNAPESTSFNCSVVQNAPSSSPAYYNDTGVKNCQMVREGLGRQRIFIIDYLVHKCHRAIRSLRKRCIRIQFIEKETMLRQLQKWIAFEGWLSFRFQNCRFLGNYHRSVHFDHFENRYWTGQKQGVQRHTFSKFHLKNQSRQSHYV